MQIGLGIPHFGELAQATEIARFAATAEKLGYRSLWVGDRVLAPTNPSDRYPGGTARGQAYPPQFTRCLDPLVVLGAAATATTSVRLGTSTLLGVLHAPLLLGRTLTSLDLLSGGRLDVGLGIGWMRDEFSATGVPWNGRGKRLDELLDVLTTLWTEQPVEHHGPLWDIPESTVDLRPVQQPHPPVLLGGFAPAALRRIGHRAQGWLPGGFAADMFGKQWDIIRGAAEHAGRDPESLRTVLRLNPHKAHSVDDIARQLDRAREHGIGEAFVDPNFLARNVDHALEFADELAARTSLN